ncbi:MAG: cyclic pyranopterin monophosphate synthase MoaC [Archaeoglobaceae archaeon]
MEFASSASERLKMVDISQKEDSLRISTAEGFIRLKKETIKAILEKKVEKGDVLATANLAGILAVKKTAELIPMCHQIPITSIDFDFSVEENGVRVKCKVKSIGKTGVEMEAITGVAIALLTIWDMVKSMEKDESGNYPETCIEKINVLEKLKIARN